MHPGGEDEDGRGTGSSSATHRPRTESRPTNGRYAAIWPPPHRLCALYGSDGSQTNTHISARVPGTGDEFLLNPFGLFFEEITASSLIRVDRHGNVTGGSEHGINKAGFIIHGAIHVSHPHLHYVMHTHSRHGVAVSMQRHGLLPASQKALTHHGLGRLP